MAPAGRSKAKRSVPASIKTISVKEARPSDIASFRPNLPHGTAQEARRDDRVPILVTHAGTPSADAGGSDRMAARLHVVMADRLSADRFAVAGWLADPQRRVARVSLGVGTGDDVDLMSHAALLMQRRAHAAFGAPPDAAVRFAFVALLSGRSADRTDALRVRLHGRAGETTEAVVPAAGDASRLADMIAALDEDDAFDVGEHMLGGWPRNSDPARHLPEALVKLAGHLHGRMGKRRDHGSTVECSVDAAIRVGTAGILIQGWLLHDDADTIREIALVSLFGCRAPLDMPLPAIARPDVLKARPGAIGARNSHCGFVAFAAIDGLACHDTFWFLELVLAGGTVRRVPFVCPPEPGPLQGIATTVALAEAAARDHADLFARALDPAIALFWRKARLHRPEPAEIVHGTPPADARVSVVVPLYGRIDFLRHQIAQFSNDPDFRAESGFVDLIYILDDPGKADELRQLARIVHGVYGLPFRVLLQRRNLGYAAATNVGAARARGALLLLLNSDVVPKTTRWIGKLARCYRDLDRCGVLGCRLLFEDGTIQHAGMTFRESLLVDGCWSNEHPGKGLAATFDPAGGARPVPAVTGACIMIDRPLFDDLGGLSEDYVIGDFEDSDLCLKAYEHGFRCYYTPEIELYHLERQSMRLIGQGDAGWRQSLTLYNMWLHSRRWGSLIPRILADLEPPAGLPA